MGRAILQQRQAGYPDYAALKGFPSAAAALPSQPARPAKWKDPAFGTVSLEEPEQTPLLVPRTPSGLPGAFVPLSKISDPSELAHQMRKRASGNRRLARGASREALLRGGSREALLRGGSRETLCVGQR